MRRAPLICFFSVSSGKMAPALTEKSTRRRKAGMPPRPPRRTTWDCPLTVEGMPPLGRVAPSTWGCPLIVEGCPRAGARRGCPHTVKSTWGCPRALREDRSEVPAKSGYGRLPNRVEPGGSAAFSERAAAGRIWKFHFEQTPSRPGGRGGPSSRYIALVEGRRLGGIRKARNAARDKWGDSEDPGRGIREIRNATHVAGDPGWPEYPGIPEDPLRPEDRRNIEFD